MHRDLKSLISYDFMLRRESDFSCKRRKKFDKSNIRDCERKNGPNPNRFLKRAQWIDELSEVDVGDWMIQPGA